MVLSMICSCIIFANRLDPEQALIWIQTVKHSDHISERNLRKSWFWENQQSTKKHEKFPMGQKVKWDKVTIIYYDFVAF